MGKGKKLPDKLRLYYRGQVKRPTHVADQKIRQLVKDALNECSSDRSNVAFAHESPDLKTNVIQQVRYRLVFGLQSALRLIKQKRTKAIIFDSSISDQLSKYLIEFASKLDAPTLQIDQLKQFINKPKFKNLLVITLVNVDEINSGIYAEGDPKPKIIERTVKVPAFQRLADFLFQDKSSPSQSDTKLKYDLPQIEFLPSSGKSKGKKEAKRESKQKAKAKSTA